MPGQGKAASGRGDTDLGAQPALGCSPQPQRCCPQLWWPRDVGPELSTLGTVPPPIKVASHTAVPTAGRIHHGTPFQDCTKSKQHRAPSNPAKHTEIISSLALLWCGREQRDSTAPAATPEALCAPGAKGPTGEGSKAPPQHLPERGNPESCWQEQELLNKEKSQHFFLFFSFVMPDPSGDRPTGLAGAPVGL